MKTLLLLAGLLLAPRLLTAQSLNETERRTFMNGADSIGSFGTWMAQSFTATAEMPVTVGAGLFIQNTEFLGGYRNTVYVDLQLWSGDPFNGGTRIAYNLPSFSRASTDAFWLRTVWARGQVNLVQGREYWLVFNAIDPFFIASPVNVLGGTGNPYQSGRSYRRESGTPDQYTEIEGTDISFEILTPTEAWDYTPPVEVSEPPAIAMVLAGLVFVWGGHRGRRKVRPTR